MVFRMVCKLEVVTERDSVGAVGSEHMLALSACLLNIKTVLTYSACLTISGIQEKEK